MPKSEVVQAVRPSVVRFGAFVVLDTRERTKDLCMAFEGAEGLLFSFVRRTNQKPHGGACGSMGLGREFPAPAPPPLREAVKALTAEGQGIFFRTLLPWVSAAGGIGGRVSFFGISVSDNGRLGSFCGGREEGRWGSVLRSVLNVKGSGLPLKSRGKGDRARALARRASVVRSRVRERVRARWGVRKVNTLV